MKKTLALLCLCCLLPITAFAGSTRESLQARIDAAKIVLDEIMATPDNSIPMNILDQAIRMEGGSFGFQIGAQSTDLVLVAINDRGFQDLLKNKFKIGGDASAAAGPVGRSGQAATDWKMSAELLSYSRNKGLFAGIDLDGTSVSQNAEDTELYFGQSQTFESILRGDVAVPQGAVPFVTTVAQYFVKSKNR
jgi:lipid-binding SYLF domain-containing protein